MPLIRTLTFFVAPILCTAILTAQVAHQPAANRDLEAQIQHDHELRDRAFAILRNEQLRAKKLFVPKQ